MAWVRVGVGGAINLGNSISFGVPAATRAGDLIIIAVVTINPSGIPASSAPSPLDWQLVGSISNVNEELVVWSRIAKSGDQAITLNVTINGGSGVAEIVTYHDATQALQETIAFLPVLDQISTNSEASGTSHVATAVVNTHTNELLIGVFGLGLHTNPNLWTPPSGMTEDNDLDSSFPRCGLELCSQFGVGGGTTGNKTATSTQSAASLNMLVSFYYAQVSFAVTTITGGAQVMDDLPSRTELLAGSHSPIRMRFRYEQRDAFNRFKRDITTAVLEGEIDLDNERAILRTFRGRLDATLLAQYFSLKDDRLAVWCDIQQSLTQDDLTAGSEWTYVSGSNGGTNVGDLLIGKPAGVQVGDLLVAHLVNSVGSAAPFFPRDDWHSIVDRDAGNSITYSHSQYWRIVDGTEPTTFRWDPGAGNDCAGAIVAYRPVIAGSRWQYEANFHQTSAGAGPWTVPGTAVSVPRKNALVIGAFGMDSGSADTFITTPAGAIVRYNFKNGATGVSVMLADEIFQPTQVPVNVWDVRPSGSPTFTVSATVVSFSCIPPPGYATVTTYEWVPSQMGLFKLAAPSIILGENGQEEWDIDGADECDDLASSWIGTTFNVPSGTKYTDAIRLLVNTANLNCSLPNEEDVTPTSYSWKPGTSFLTIVNDLAFGLGYWHVWAEPDGWITSRRRMYQFWQYSSPGPDIPQYASLSQSDVYWSAGDDPKMIIPPLIKSPDVGSRANIVRFVTQDPGRLINTAEARNLDPLSPISTYNQPEKQQQINADYIADNWVATSPVRPGTNVNMFSFAPSPIVDLMLEEAHSRIAKLRTLLDPRRQAHETYRLSIPGVEENSRWYCFGWTLRLDVDAVMEHKIGQMTDPMQISSTSFQQGIL